MTDEQIETLTGLVEFLARRFDKRTPSHVSLDDITSAAWVGALEAGQRYDASKGCKLRTFCEPRIKGAILDFLRSNDWVPRAIRSKERAIARATDKLTAENAAPPEATEVATELGWTLDELADVMPAHLQSFDTGTHENGDDTSLHEMIAAPRFTHSPEIRNQVEVGFGALSEGEAEVIERVYLREEKARDTAEALGVTESRVSQIRKTAVEKMQVRLAGQYAA
jgi:RNA polymerase sigma factor for flagellar operon FliA